MNMEYKKLLEELNHATQQLKQL